MIYTPEFLIRPRRSFIFCPAIKPEMFSKALGCGTDIVCVELEDAIPIKHKDLARKNAMALFDSPQADDGVERVIRINSIQEAVGLADLQAILSSRNETPAIMVPKVKSPDEIKLLDHLLSEGSMNTRLHVIIETNEGLEAAYEIAQASSRIDALFFGGIDMAAELRCRSAWEPLLYARSRVVHAAAAAGIDVIDVPYLDLNDMKGLKEEACLSRDLGFNGKGAIHPKQISIINQTFTPKQDEIARAKKIIDAYEAAQGGVAVVDGKLIEKPVIREMQRILSIAERVSS